MKPVPALVESATAQVEAAVRAAAASLREAEVQLAKAEKRTEAARGAVAMRRLELGRALILARKQWPARGPNAKGWGEFLEREGLEQSTAWRMMDDAGYTETADAETPDPAPRVSCDRPKTHENSAPDPLDGAPRAYALLAGFDLRLGDWQPALYQIGKVDALITDPPFGAATHEGSATTRADGSSTDGQSPDFECWRPEDVTEFMHAWAPRVRGWMACLTSHDLIAAYERAYESVDRYKFAPVPCVMRGMNARLRGDGPSSWTAYLMVARPRTAEFAKWGTLPGAYVGGANPNASRGRGKPRWLLDEIVRDYSRHGDLVCDPLAGWGSTLFAALGLGRRAIGAERDAVAHAHATAEAKVPIGDEDAEPAKGGDASPDEAA